MADQLVQAVLGWETGGAVVDGPALSTAPTGWVAQSIPTSSWPAPVSETSPACRLRATECGTSTQREWSSNGRRWTWQRDATLRRRYRAGVPRQRVAAALAGRPTRRCPPAGAQHPRPPTQPSLVARCRRPAPRRRRGAAATRRGGAAARPAGHSGPLATTPARLQRRGAHAWTPAEDQELGRVWRRAAQRGAVAYRRLGRAHRRRPHRHRPPGAWRADRL
jgi:hypothetical protein